MAILECPTRKDLPSYKYLISLDGVFYTLTYVFNMRMNKWMISLEDANNIPIVGQVPVISGAPLFNRFSDKAVPPGVLFPFDSSQKNIDPGRFDLGDRVRIFYVEEGTEI